MREPDAAAAQRATPDEPEASETQSSAAAERQDRPHDRERALEGEPAAPDEQGSGGLEDLAWAGIAAAAEAATIGVRLASRAMEAVKDAGKRT